MELGQELKYNAASWAPLHCCPNNRNDFLFLVFFSLKRVTTSSEDIAQLLVDEDVTGTVPVTAPMPDRDE